MLAFWEYPSPRITHTIDSYWIPSQNKTKSKLQIWKNLPKILIVEFRIKKHYTWHTFGTCLISCINMKWLQQVWLMIQSWYDYAHRWMDRRKNRWMDRRETSNTSFQLHWSRGIKKIQCTTHPLNLVNKMCKCKMDPDSIVKYAEWTWFCPQTERQMDGWTRWNKPLIIDCPWTNREIPWSIAWAASVWGCDFIIDNMCSF